MKINKKNMNYKMIVYKRKIIKIEKIDKVRLIKKIKYKKLKKLRNHKILIMEIKI